MKKLNVNQIVGLETMKNPNTNEMHHKCSNKSRTIVNADKRDVKIGKTCRFRILCSSGIRKVLCQRIIIAAEIE